MLVSENLLVSRAEITHLLVMGRADVAVKIRPTKTGKVAVGIRAVVPQEEDGVAHYILVDVLDANVVVGAGNVGIRILVEPLGCIVGEDNIWRRCL